MDLIDNEKSARGPFKIRSVSDGKRVGVGPPTVECNVGRGGTTKIRSVSDGKRVGVGPHAN